jgi:hypothetical protein
MNDLVLELVGATFPMNAPAPSRIYSRDRLC